MSYKSTKRTIGRKSQEIRRCNDLRVRIKTWCKQEALTQPQFAEKLDVTRTEMSNFMTGLSLTGSRVYTKAMSYLRVRMPLSKCSVSDIENMTNTKWGLVRVK